MNQLLYITWDPSLGIHIGSFTLRYYSLMYVIAFGLGFYLMEFIFKKDKEDKKLLDPLFIYMFLAVIIGARLGHVLFYQKQLLIQDPLAVFLPIRTKPHFEFTGYSGLASHGAAIGILISLYLFTRKYLKRTFYWILDRIVIPVSIGGMFIRFGNFFNSEIIGKPSSLPWAVLFIQQDTDEYGNIVPRHPSQLYEAFGYLLLFISLIYIYLKTDKKKYSGWIFGYFLIVLFGIRFIVEFFKEPQGEEYINWLGLNTGQWLSVPFIIAGICILIAAKNRIYTSKAI
ncbi:prolipoprotein diacylglyceryl transferase [Apibacter mensalis]|uniref:Phosphatidylglycerol--prolipoprotein diacylglyceryl transferase n=1 Tax=Apibacter mensalis TaxID=1586267 RepID=A0A0X3ALX9_9FLAO|nr:prolipoprotein diacylglyceryl transferase [Apibacter mensalis]CVK15401.1 prolipoprotein diacylglyceryl transferase [Apibacter mensalis]